jgi:hypothetical protein
LERWKNPITGEEDVPVVELTNGLTSHPTAFKCVFVPRPERIGGMV